MLYHTARFFSLIVFTGAATIVGCSGEDATAPVETAGRAELGGTFTVSTLDIEPQTTAFNDAIGLPVEFSFTFDGFDMERKKTDDNEFVSYVTTTPATVSLRPGSPLPGLDALERSLQGQPIRFELVGLWGGRIHAYTQIVGERGAEYFGIEVSAFYVGDVDENGFPAFEDFPAVSGRVSLFRYTDHGGFAMTDRASGSLAMTLRGVSASR
jgi:hypothetical protein